MLRRLFLPQRCSTFSASLYPELRRVRYLLFVVALTRARFVVSASIVILRLSDEDSRRTSTISARQKFMCVLFFACLVSQKNFCTVFRSHAQPHQLTRASLPRTMRSQSHSSEQGIGRPQAIVL